MDTLLDCVIVGGGPAGLNAALVLGRARRNIVLFDTNQARNRVTQEAHGFITRDGVKPAEFRRIAHEELLRYPSVRFREIAVTSAVKKGRRFEITTANGETYRTRKIILATGLKEELPNVPGIHDYYGRSFFSCPYCDGWESKDRPLVIISETEHAFDMVKSVYQWSRDLALCTNGHYMVTREERKKLAGKNIPLYEQKIKSLVGREGILEKVVFEDGSEERRVGGFVSPQWSHPVSIAKYLGCTENDHGGIQADDFGRTTVDGVFAAGDAANIVPAQLIVAAAGGSRAAIGVNSELTAEDF